MQYFLSVKSLTDYIHEVESSLSKDVGNDFIEVKLLLQNHGDLCYTMEALSQLVRIAMCVYTSTRSCMSIICTRTRTHRHTHMHTIL